MLFKPEKFVEEQKELVSEKIDGKAIIACSGGVDLIQKCTVRIYVHLARFKSLERQFKDRAAGCILGRIA